METDLDQLPIRMKNLEEEAAREFSNAFGPLFYRLFIGLGAHPAEAEALATTCISDVWRKLDRFDDRGLGSFKAWALRLARNAWLDEKRRHQGVESLVNDDVVMADAEFEPTLNNDVAAAVVQALDRLSEMDRAVIRLRYLEADFSFVEIGRKLDISEGAARLRHHRAIRALKQMLREFSPVRRATAVHETLSDQIEGESPI